MEEKETHKGKTVMEFALLRCCVTTPSLKQYESSTNALLEKLGLNLVDVKEFNCCGYPLKNSDFKAHALLSARNLALAEQKGLGITTLCSCCYGSTKHINQLMKEEAGFRAEINSKLEKEGLRYQGDIEVRHLHEIFRDEIGFDRIEQQVSKPFSGLKVAVHYGCHLIRPEQIVQPDAPSIFDRLVEITGAESIDWPAQTECCGAPVLGTNDDLSMDLTRRKIIGAIESHADYLCVACPFCQLQFDRIQHANQDGLDKKQPLPSILYTQLLGLSLGVDWRQLGIDGNQIDISGIMAFSAESS